MARARPLQRDEAATHRHVVLLSACAGAALAALIGYFVVREGSATDFAVFWSAHQVANPYNVAELRAALAEAIGPDRLPSTDWPYPYPPTFLLMTVWFKLLPMPAAYLAWVSLSGAGLVASARHPAAPLLLFSPWVILALMAGQSSMAVGALLLLGLTQLQRPQLAGALLAAAACTKPQFAILVMIGLTFAQAWRVLAWTAAWAGLAAVAATLVYGLESWGAWLALMPAMLAHTGNIGSHLDLPGAPLKLAALAIGLALIWRHFRGSSADEKMLAAAGTSLLCLPHSLWYNSAMLAPAVFSAAIRRGLAGWIALPLLVLRASGLAIVASLIVLIVPWRRRAQVAEQQA